VACARLVRLRAQGARLHGRRSDERVEQRIGVSRRESLGLWDRMAAGWGRDGDSIWEASRAVGEWMVAAVRPGAGDTVLELAAGPDDTGFAAASLVGDSGRLICTDFAPEMVAVARPRGAELGLA